MSRAPKPFPIAPLVLIAAIAYLMLRRPEASGIGHALRVGGIVLGMLWVAWWWVTRGVPRTAGEAADDILRQQKAIYGGPHEIRVLSADEFRAGARRLGLDVSYYEQAHRALAAQGFKHLGEIEDLTATAEFPQMRTFVRVMSGDGGTIMAACYHVRMRGFFRLAQLVGLVPKNLKMLDLETEMSDGSFIVTANAADVDRTVAIPGVGRVLEPLATPPERLLERHRERVRQCCVRERDRGVVPLALRTLAEVIASQHRLQAVKNAHRRRGGYIDARELRQIAGEDSDAVRDVAAELERRRAGKDEIRMTNDE